jgi:acetyl-CoA C-acetyltransferase
MEAVAALKPLPPDGTVTAGNCRPLNDGAAAVVIMSDQRAAEPTLTAGTDRRDRRQRTQSELMGLGPSMRVAESWPTGMTVDDIDLVDQRSVRCPGDRLPLEISADWTSSTCMANIAPPPFGASGARIMTMLLNAMRVQTSSSGSRRCASVAKDGHRVGTAF